MSSEKIEELLRLAEKDDKTLKTILNYARSTKFNREDGLSELRKIVEGDERALEAVLRYARRAREP